MVRIAKPRARVDFIRTWLKTSMDVFSEKKMIDLIWRKNKRRFGSETPGAHLETSCADIYEPRKLYVLRDESCIPVHYMTLMLFDRCQRRWRYYEGTQSTITGMSMVNDHYLDPGLDSRDSQFQINLPPDGLRWAGERLTIFQTTSRPDHMLPDVRSEMTKHPQREARQQWNTETQAGRCMPIERNL